MHQIPNYTRATVRELWEAVYGKKKKKTDDAFENENLHDEEHYYDDYDDDDADCTLLSD